MLLQVGVSHAALLQGLRNERAIGPVVNKPCETSSGGLVLAGLKRELRLLENSILGVARVGTGFEQRSQRDISFVAAAHQAQGAAFLVVSVIFVGSVGCNHLIVKREGLRVTFGHVISISQT